MNGLIRRRPPELLVVVQRADDWAIREENREVAAFKIFEQAGSERADLVRFAHRKLDRGGIVEWREWPGIYANLAKERRHPRFALFELERPVTDRREPNRARKV